MQIDGADNVDDPENWEDLPADEMRVIDNMLHANSKNEHLPCYCHTLHLTVFDGLGVEIFVSSYCENDQIIVSSSPEFRV